MRLTESDSHPYKCTCGVFFKNAGGLKNHMKGEPHRCAMTEVTARLKGHHFALSGFWNDRVKQLTAAGYGAHFSVVETIIEGFTSADGRHRERTISRAITTSQAMWDLMHKFASHEDDMTENTMHAALVFVHVYGDDVTGVVLAMLDHELSAVWLDFSDKECEAMEDIFDVSLITVLKANGVQSPARTLANLLPHLLMVAVESKL